MSLLGSGSFWELNIFLTLITVGGVGVMVIVNVGLLHGVVMVCGGKIKVWVIVLVAMTAVGMLACVVIWFHLYS